VPADGCGGQAALACDLVENLSMAEKDQQTWCGALALKIGVEPNF
jgi:hypothetical protein